MSNRRYDMQQETRLGSTGSSPSLDFVYQADGTDGVSAKLLYVTSAKYEQDWHSEMHSHEFSELFYILSGRGEFCLNGTRFPLRPDDLVVVGPQVLHTEISEPEHPLEYVVLGLRGIQFHMRSPAEQRDCYLLHFREGHSDLRPVLQLLVREIQGAGADREEICQNLLNILLLQILRNRDLSLSRSTVKQASRECAYIRRYIEDHFKEPLTLSELAEKAHLNKFYMSHEFKATYGLSPINYMIACRLRESKHLLSTTDYSLSQISAIVGFSSASYFSQSFKKSVRISPQEYRRLVRNQQRSTGLPGGSLAEAGV